MKASVYWGIPMWVIFVILAVVLLIQVKPKWIGEFHEDFLSLQVSKGILGACAIFIILHHISQKLGSGTSAGALSILEDIGVCFVGLFFFFSGYGLLKSVRKKDNYLKGFLKKRYAAILIPFYVCIILFVLYNILNGAKYTSKELVSFLSGWILLNTHMWYIVEIAVLYLAFYLINRFVQNKSIVIGLMAIFVILLMIGSVLLGHGKYWFQGEWWYNTSFLFVIGMMIANWEQQIICFVKKWYYLVLLVVLGIFIALYKATEYMLQVHSYWSEVPGVTMGYSDKFMTLSCQLPMVISFVLLILLITMKIQFKNKILDFLGSISLEIYLLHGLFLEMFSSTGKATIPDPFLYMMAVIGSSIVLATVVHYICKFAINGIVKK